MLTLQKKIGHLVKLNIVLLLILFSGCTEKTEEIKTEENLSAPLLIKNISVETVNASNQMFRNPIFSEDGSKLFFTSTVNSGLWMHDLKIDTTYRLNEETVSAGNYLSDISSSSVIFIHSSYDEKEKKRRFFVAKQKLTADSVINIYSSERRLSQLELSAADKISFFERDSLLVLDISNSRNYNWKNTGVNILKASRNSIIEYSAGRMNRYTVLEQGNVLWPQIVNQNEFLYNGSGKGTFLFNRETGKSKQIGDFNRPIYSPANNLLIYIREENDGHTVSSSRLYIMNLDTKYGIPVDPDNNYVEENPAWSPDGSQIVYNTVEGKIKIAHLEFPE